MCNCLKTIIEKIESEPQKYIDKENVEVNLIHFENKYIWPKERLYSKVKIYHTFKLKKTGARSPEKTYSIDVIHSYCAFCGEKLHNENEVKIIADAPDVHTINITNEPNAYDHYNK